jgi:plastocyanin
MPKTNLAPGIAGWGLITIFSGLLNAQAPAVDRVGFPADYKQTFTKLLQFDRADNGQIRVIWGNALAAGTPWWEPYPYGSVLLFEAWTSKRDAQGGASLDEKGRLIPDQLTTVFVQRKERGFGEAYGSNRNGEWEYVAYMPNGTVATAPQNTAACAVCHIQAGPPADYVFRRRDFANPFNPGGASGAGPRATMSRYAFVPGDLTVKRGTTVTWYNDDEVAHQITSPHAGFGSDPMFTGASYGYKFNQPGTYEVRCTIHPGMRSRVTVE